MSYSKSRQQVRTLKPVDGLTKDAPVDPLSKQINLCGASKDGEEKPTGQESGDSDVQRLASKAAPPKRSK